MRDVVEVGKGFGASAYYLDEGARDCIVERNVAQGVPMPTHNHITRNITVRDNVFIADKDMTVSFQRSVGLHLRAQHAVRARQAHRAPAERHQGLEGQRDLSGTGLGKDGAPQAFTISDTMPTEPAPGRKTWPAEAVRVAAAPTLDGDIRPPSGRGRSRRWIASRRGTPSAARRSWPSSPTTTQCLYVSANVTMFAPAKVSTDRSGARTTAWRSASRARRRTASRPPS